MEVPDLAPIAGFPAEPPSSMTRAQYQEAIDAYNRVEARLDRFTRWSDRNDIKIEGVKLKKFEGRLGISVVTTAPLLKHDVIVEVPSASMVSIADPEVMTRFPAHCTVHGRLAAFVAEGIHNNEHDVFIWSQVWPSMHQYDQVMPVNWPSQLQHLLPPVAKDILAKQRTRLQTDWHMLQPFLPRVSEDVFCFSWLFVNSRSFYWPYPRVDDNLLPKPRDELKDEDCLALCPVMDCFNHQAEGCIACYDSTGYKVVCDRDYDEGEEIFLTYGALSNDQLLTEYGFGYPGNEHDHVMLDHLILPLLTEHQVDLLKRHSLYKRYSLSPWADPPSLSLRTQAVLRLLALPELCFHRLVAGFRGDTADQVVINARLCQMLVDMNSAMLANENRLNRLPVDSGANPVHDDNVNPGGTNGRGSTTRRPGPRPIQIDMCRKRLAEVRVFLGEWIRPLLHLGFSVNVDVVLPDQATGVVGTDDQGDESDDDMDEGEVTDDVMDEDEDEATHLAMDEDDGTDFDMDDIMDEGVD